MSDKIKNQLEKYEIKTSSKEILNHFYEIRDAKIIKNKSRFFGLKLISSLIAATAMILTFVKVILPGNEHKGVRPSYSNTIPNGATLVEDDNENHVAFQLLSGIGLLDFIDSDSTSDLSVRRNKNISIDQFSEIVDVFDKANELINSNNFNNIEKKVYQGDFAISDKHYPYMMNIIGNDDIIVYYDSKIESDDRHETETEFHGEIHYKNKIFTILGEKEEENLDSEFELTIFIDKYNYVKIEQEIEKDEFEYKYLIHENGEKTYEIDYSEKGKKTFLEIKDNIKKYYFNITKNDSYILIDYSFLDFKGNITLVYEGNIRIYFENTLSEEIIKE